MTPIEPKKIAFIIPPKKIASLICQLVVVVKLIPIGSANRKFFMFPVPKIITLPDAWSFLLYLEGAIEDTLQ